ncbi:MAG: PLP-dependent cysteine synthase family protein [Candidatus Thermoplasmatota archaeon]|nr:PLP-dependent cysteine synthase family protein [Candidatus Thermoplasmatota archaeon]
MSTSAEYYGTIRKEAYSTGIGRTPMLEFGNASGTLYVKAEWYNRFRSVKDRAGFFMLKMAEMKSVLTKNRIIIEASSGNTGIAIASIAKLLGYSAEIYVPASSSRETIARLRDTGQKIVEVEDENSRAGKINIDASVRALKERISEDPDRFVNFDQYSNASNTLAHYYTTGPEVDFMNLGITHVVTSIGTGGTVTGLAKYFKEKHPEVQIIAAQPSPDHHIQGLKNLSVSDVPPILESNRTLIDKWITVTDDDARAGVRAILKRTGILVGLSSGANYMAGQMVLAGNPGTRILTVFPDSAEKYREQYVASGTVDRKTFEDCEEWFSMVPENALKCSFSGS